MKRDHVIDLVILLTFVGMVGLYVGAYLAWQKYQASTAKGTAVGNVLSLLGFAG